MNLSRAAATLFAIYSFIGGRMVEAQSNGDILPRVIGYQQGWQPCFDFVNSKYTHIMIAFAVTYTGFSPTLVCSDVCTLLPDNIGICKDSNFNTPAGIAKVKEWRDAGKKVMVSIGGDGQDQCWDDPNSSDLRLPTGSNPCRDNLGALVDQLVLLVKDHQFDGVDINYEAGVGNEDTAFVKELTVALRQKLDSDPDVPKPQLISITPRDDAMESAGDSTAQFFQSIQNDQAYRNSISWIQPQFYNGNRIVKTQGIDGANSGHQSTWDIFDGLAKQLFGGDYSKVVFGFCAAGCDGHETTADEAKSVIGDIQKKDQFACIGGAFFWEVLLDTSSPGWSNTMADALSSCKATTPAPTTLAPVTTPAPTPIQEDKTPVLIRGVKIKKSKAKSPTSSKAKSPKTSVSKARLFQTGNTNPNQVLTIDQLQNICSNYCVNQAAGVASSVASSVTISGSSSHISSTATSVSSETTVSTTTGNYSG